jgi:hypothetical protein
MLSSTFVNMSLRLAGGGVMDNSNECAAAEGLAMNKGLLA